MADRESNSGIVVPVRIHRPVLQPGVEGIARGAIEPDNRATVVRSIIPGRLLIGGGKDPADSRRGIGARAAQAGSNELPLPLRSLKNIHTLDRSN